MRNQIKAKLFVTLSIACILLFGTAVSSSAAGTLSIAAPNMAKAGETITVTVYAEDENGAAFTADNINVTYDAAKLEYVSSTAPNATGGNGSVKAGGSEVNLTFRAIGSGDVYVKAEGGYLTAAGTHIMVSGKSSGNAASGTNASGTDAAGQNMAAPAKSGDNSLSALKLSHGTLSPAFQGHVTAYTAEVDSSVNEIAITPVVSHNKAQVTEITGNTNLKEGENLIKVVVKAENGEMASYKITVTKKAAAAKEPSESGETSGTQGSTEGQETAGQPGTAGGQDAAGQPGAAAQPGTDTAVIDGVTYTLSNDFTKKQIPEGFSKAEFEYQGKLYQAVSYDSGYLGMYYMVNEAGEGKFFIYDENRKQFYPYVRLNGSSHYVIMITVPNGVIPPDNYAETKISIGGVDNIPVYQYMGSKDDELVRVQTAEGEVLMGGQSYFYLFYGIDASGKTYWYQYDAWQGTYQRFNEDALSKDSVPKDYEKLAQAYQTLDEKQRAARIRDRNVIAVLIFVTAALLLLSLNLFLKIRDLKAEANDPGEMDPAAEKPVSKKPVREKSVRKKMKKKESGESSPRVEEEEPEETAFYFGDNRTVMDEFGAAAAASGKSEPKQKEEPKLFGDDDDDIEFFDF